MIWLSNACGILLYAIHTFLCVTISCLSLFVIFHEFCRFHNLFFQLCFLPENHYAIASIKRYNCNTYSSRWLTGNPWSLALSIWSLMAFSFWDAIFPSIRDFLFSVHLCSDLWLWYFFCCVWTYLKPSGSAATDFLLCFISSSYYTAMIIIIAGTVIDH